MLYAMPHLACARAFLLWGLRDYLLLAGPGWQSRLRTALLWLGVWIMQPLTVVVGWAVIAVHLAVTGAWQIWRARYNKSADWAEWKRYFWRAVWVALLSAPLVVYTIVSFRIDPFLRSWETQNRILSPPFTHYLLAYGLILPLAILGIRPLLRGARWTGWLVVGWLAIFPLLAYAPYTLQRRLPEGVWVAMVILFTKWVECGGPAGQRWGPRWAALSFLSTIAFLTGGILTTASPRAPIFRPVGEVQAFEFLAGNAGPRDVVLAAYPTANPLPAWAGVRVIVGHGPESIHKVELLGRVSCFYKDCTDAERIKLLNEFGVRYVFWGPAERQLGNWDPRAAAFMKPVYQQGDFLIFKFEGAS
ncbi:MAG: hypothetical protein EHM21_04865 [Chloroflexi bacterium]|nr:MAG: hypothetical protein EHM21_04865 [Chloroflexota bacterium]